jgi:prepilin-type N-terminal cleavage/methylation domain-containing protein
MISAAKTTESRAGFTLIEIVMVLAIAAIVMGCAVGLMIFSSDERTLRNTSGEVELMAKRARTIAILHQTPYSLEFSEGKVRLLPLAQAGQDFANRRTLGRDRPEATPEDRQIQLHGGMKLFVRRWNSDKWLPTDKKAFQVWRFDPDGLSEPVSVRLTLGESWSEDVYHPLSASIRESHLEAR